MPRLAQEIRYALVRCPVRSDCKPHAGFNILPRQLHVGRNPFIIQGQQRIRVHSAIAVPGKLVALENRIITPYDRIHLGQFLLHHLLLNHLLCLIGEQLSCAV